MKTTMNILCLIATAICTAKHVRSGLIIEGSTLRPSFARHEAEGMLNQTHPDTIKNKTSSLFLIKLVFGINCPIDTPFGLDNGGHCCYFNKRQSDGKTLRLSDPVSECKGTIQDGDMIACPFPGAICIDHHLTIKCKAMISS